MRRAAGVLKTSRGADVSTGFVASMRGRAAQLLEQGFLPRVRELIAAAPVAHADETIARAAGKNMSLHEACTEYLTAMHTGDRTMEAIDAGGIWPAFDGILVRDGYGGYTHLDHIAHAWCGAHLLRDLRSVHDGDPDGQLWAKAMADTFLDVKTAAEEALADGLQALPAHALARIRNRYLGALAHGRDRNTARHGPRAEEASKLIRRFEPVFEADFLPVSYGFRPKRSAIDACESVRVEANRGREWVLEADIDRFGMTPSWPRWPGASWTARC